MSGGATLLSLPLQGASVTREHGFVDSKPSVNSGAEESKPVWVFIVTEMPNRRQTEPCSQVTGPPCTILLFEILWPSCSYGGNVPWEIRRALV